MAPENKISLKMPNAKKWTKHQKKQAQSCFAGKNIQKFVTDRKIVTFSIHDGT